MKKLEEIRARAEKAECSISGCDRPLSVRKTGYCKSHQQRFRRGATPEEMHAPLARIIPMVGRHFGRLEVVVQAESQQGRAYWECKCDCGATVAVAGDQLRNGKTKSCGCYRGIKSIELRLVHGHSVGGAKTPEYESWAGMKRRCLNPQDRAYANYGGRGIRMHQAWVDSFPAFYEYMGAKPGPEYSVDRINNDGNYEPGNVRWATPKEQANNRRSSRRYTTIQEALQ